MTTIVQITAGLAPEEALRFVDLLARDIAARARKCGAHVERSSTKRSMVRLECSRLPANCQRDLFALEGTHLLHDGSRGRGSRKRWFVGVLVWETALPSEPLEVRAGDVLFESCRAGGPGGQHVNRTASAVRAVHIPTGLSVRVQSTRSQHQNKREALRLLRQKHDKQLDEGRDERQRAMRRTGFAFERGNAAFEYVLVRGRLRASGAERKNDAK